MRYQKHIQHKPKSDGSGKTDFTITLKLTTESTLETNLLLQQFGYDGVDTDLDFKICTGKGRITLDDVPKPNRIIFTRNYYLNSKI
jgi:hypothetical protein